MACKFESKGFGFCFILLILTMYFGVCSVVFGYPANLSFLIIPALTTLWSQLRLGKAIYSYVTELRFWHVVLIMVVSISVSYGVYSTVYEKLVFSFMSVCVFYCSIVMFVLNKGESSKSEDI